MLKKENIIVDVFSRREVEKEYIYVLVGFLSCNNIHYHQYIMKLQGGNKI